MRAGARGDRHVSVCVSGCVRGTNRQGYVYLCGAYSAMPVTSDGEARAQEGEGRAAATVLYPALSGLSLNREASCSGDRLLSRM